MDPARVCAKRRNPERQAALSPLDLIDLLDEERRRSENHAFSPQDAARKRNLEIVVHHCASTRSNLRRRLSQDRDKLQPAHINKRQIAACLDTLFDACCGRARAESVRCVPAGDIPPAPLCHAVQACVRPRVATRTEPDHLHAR
jgi:hypothetical protein